MLDYNKAISPSRTYVAQCFKADFSGYYFRQFFLPDERSANNANDALRFYMNELDAVSCVEAVFPFEDYNNLKVKE